MQRRARSKIVVAAIAASLALAAYLTPGHFGLSRWMAQNALRRGHALQSKGDLAGAVIEFDRSISFDPEFADARNARGDARRRLGQLDKAVEDFGEVIRLKSDDSAGYYNRAVTFEVIGQPRAALADFEQSIQRMRTRLGGLQESQKGRFDVSVRTQIIETREELDEALLADGRLATDLGDYTRALRDFEEAAASPNTLGKTAGALGRARVHALEGKLEPAFTEIEEFVQGDPDNAGGLMLRGFLLLFHKRDANRAAADFARAVEKGLEYRKYRGMLDASDPKIFGRASWLGFGAPFYPDAYYLVIWQHLAHERLGAADVGELRRDVTRFAGVLYGEDALTGKPLPNSLRTTLVTWPGPILAMLLGESAPERVETVAGEQGGKNQARMLCDAQFYIGLFKLRSSIDEAQSRLKSAAEHCPPIALERVAARLELEASTGRPK
jgi:tetratricopeptide (TPR) repeat protein